MISASCIERLYLSNMFMQQVCSNIIVNKISVFNCRFIYGIQPIPNKISFPSFGFVRFFQISLFSCSPVAKNSYYVRTNIRWLQISTFPLHTILSTIKLDQITPLTVQKLFLVTKRITVNQEINCTRYWHIRFSRILWYTIFFISIKGFMLGFF